MPQFTSGATPFTSIGYFVENSFLNKAPGNITGFLKPSRFGASFRPPRGIFGSDTELLGNMLRDNIESIEVPALNVAQQDAPFPLAQQITDRSVSNFSAVFYESAEMQIFLNMYKWVNASVSHYDDDNNYSRRYLDDVKGEIDIVPITLNGEVSRIKHTLTFVRPTQVQPVQFNIGSENEVAKVTVSFAYRYHTMVQNGNVIEPTI